VKINPKLRTKIPRIMKSKIIETKIFDFERFFVFCGPETENGLEKRSFLEFPRNF
jgi:hypothetical protein